MIESFGDKQTEQIHQGHWSKKLPDDIQHRARRKLRMLNQARAIQDLSVPPGNRLETLHGDLDGFWSIRINQQWRIVLRWHDGLKTEVIICDYHSSIHPMSTKKLLPLIHPGEILLEEFIRPLDLSLAALARATGIPASRLTEITKCRRGITAETALRLAKFFGTTAGFWVGLQAEHDLEAAQRLVGARVEREVVAMTK